MYLHAVSSVIKSSSFSFGKHKHRAFQLGLRASVIIISNGYPGSGPLSLLPGPCYFNDGLGFDSIIHEMVRN